MERTDEEVMEVAANILEQALLDFLEAPLRLEPVYRLSDRYLINDALLWFRLYQPRTEIPRIVSCA